MANVISIAKDAISAVQVMDGTANKVLPEDIASIVKLHAKIAAASAWLPVAGLDVVAATANVWTMYVRINNKLGLKFSENKMKSIGSAVVSNLAQNIAVIAAGEVAKASIPFIGNLWAGAAMTGALYAMTLTSGYIYLKAISIMAQNDGDIDKGLQDALKDKNTINELLKTKK